MFCKLVHMGYTRGGSLLRKSPAHCWHVTPGSWQRTLSTPDTSNNTIRSAPVSHQYVLPSLTDTALHTRKEVLHMLVIHDTLLCVCCHSLSTLRASCFTSNTDTVEDCYCQQTINSWSPPCFNSIDYRSGAVSSCCLMFQKAHITVTAHS